MSYVYVVTDTDLGWDCVVAVFSNEEAAEACVADRGDTCTITAKNLESEYQE